jgi:hypothetical protein
VALRSVQKCEWNYRVGVSKLDFLSSVCACLEIYRTFISAEKFNLSVNILSLSGKCGVFQIFINL